MRPQDCKMLPKPNFEDTCRDQIREINQYLGVWNYDQHEKQIPIHSSLFGGDYVEYYSKLGWKVTYENLKLYFQRPQHD